MGWGSIRRRSAKRRTPFGNCLLKPTLRKLAENLLCLAVLAALGAAAYYPIWLRNAVPAELDGLFSLQPWEEARPADMADASGMSTESLSYYAWYAFLHDTSSRGDSPLWNPRELCGVPFMALWSTRVFSPFSLPFYYLSVEEALRLSVLLKLIVAAWCAFYMARRLGFSAAPAFLVGAVFELSGVFLLWQAYPLSDTLPWLPLWVLFLNRLAVGQYRYWPFGGMVLALMLAGGDPRAAGMLAIFGFFFLVFQHGKIRPVLPLLMSIASLLLGIVLGVLLLGVQIVPYVEWLRHAAPLASAGTHAWPRFSDMIVMILPHFFGATHAAIDSSSYGWNPQTAGVVYAGLVNVLLLVLWLALRFSAPESLRRRVEGLLLTALLFSAFGFAFGNRFQPHLFPRYFFLANDLVLGLVGAAAVEEWVDLNAVECKRALKRFFAMLFALATLIAAAAAVRFEDYRPDAPALSVQVGWAVGMTAAFVLLLGITVLKPSRRFTAYGASALVVAELMMMYMPRMAHVDAAHFFPETDFVRVLRDSGGRVGGGTVVASWPLGMHGIWQMRGPREARSKRFDAFAARLHDDPLLLRRTASDTLLLTKDDIQGPFATARSSLRIRHVLPTGAVLFEDLDVKPRVWMAYDWVSEPSGAPERIASTSPPVVETTIAAPRSGDEEDPREQLSVHGGNDHVVVQTDLERPGLLVLTDAFYPGWKAYIDDAPTPILGVDSLFRGVEVGKGQHTVEFMYEPESLRIGLMLSMAGACLFIVGLVFHGIRSALRRWRGRAT